MAAFVAVCDWRCHLFRLLDCVFWYCSTLEVKEKGFGLLCSAEYHLYDHFVKLNVVKYCVQ